MPATPEQFAELMSIVDAHAGRRHSLDGVVSEALDAVLARYDEMRGSMYDHMHDGVPCPNKNCARPNDKDVAAQGFPEDAAFWTDDADGDPIIPDPVAAQPIGEQALIRSLLHVASIEPLDTAMVRSLAEAIAGQRMRVVLAEGVIVHPGDTLVIQMPEDTPLDEVDRAFATIRERLPEDCRALVLGGGIHVKVLRGKGSDE